MSSVAKEYKRAVAKAIWHVTGYEADLISSSFTLRGDLDLDADEVARVAFVLDKEFATTVASKTVSQNDSVTIGELARVIRSVHSGKDSETDVQSPH